MLLRRLLQGTTVGGGQIAVEKLTPLRKKGEGTLRREKVESSFIPNGPKAWKNGGLKEDGKGYLWFQSRELGGKEKEKKTGSGIA